MATVKVYKYKFGNYLDTRVANISDLEAHFDGIEPLETFENINFSYNDGLNATIVLPIQDSDINEINYLTVETDEIKPYFILSYVYNLQNQYTLALKFDSVLANLDIIKNSTANVSRAFVPDTDKRIFNNEGIEVTQIKQQEIPLRHSRYRSLGGWVREDVGWFAVYMDSKIGSTTDAEDELVLKVDSQTLTPSATYATMDDVPFKEYINNNAYFLNLKESIIFQNRTYKDTIKSGAVLVRHKNPPLIKKVTENNVSNYSGNWTYTDTKGYFPSWEKREFYLDNMKMFEFLATGAYPINYKHAGIILDNSDASSLIVNESNLKTCFASVKSTYNSKQFHLNNVTSSRTEAQLISVSDKIIKIGTNNYRVKVNYESEGIHSVYAANADTNVAYLKSKIADKNVVNPPTHDPSEDILNLEIDAQVFVFNGDLDVRFPAETTFEGPNNACVVHKLQVTKIRITLEEITTLSTLEIATYGGSGVGSGNLLEGTANDAPYKILLFPFGNLAGNHQDAPYYANYTKYSYSTTISVIKNLIKDYGGGTSPRIYDVQRLPYSSINLFEYNNYQWDGLIVFKYDSANSTVKNNNCYLITKDSKNLLIFFNAQFSTRTFDITLDDFIKDNVKIDSIARKARIVSNSLKSSYEYDYVKNKYKNSFRINVELKPIVTFLNIDFIADIEGLYYTNFNDGRGLIISEDLSVTQLTDAFMAYQRENFNYLNSFNSEQQYQREYLAQQQSNQDAELALKTKQSWEKYGMTTAVNLLVGTGAGAVKGGILGAAVGFGAGLVKTGVDAISTSMSIHHQTQSLALSQSQARGLLTLDQAQAKEQFDFRIKNIQALANKLDKVTGITMLDKLTPFIEIYDTTIEEKNRLRQFFKYNAYNINTIDALASYIDILDESYVKATIVRASKPLSNIIMQDINTRLASGVYFVKET